MIELSNVTKRYGDTIAVDDLSFEVRSGEVTGFLGPNGAGKSTTMRMIVGLDTPTEGNVAIDGRQYRDLRFPLRHVGALLEARAAHPARSARDHLRWLADSNAIGRARVAGGPRHRGPRPTPRTAASAATRWAWASASGSPPPCSAIPARSSSTSR